MSNVESKLYTMFVHYRGARTWDLSIRVTIQILLAATLDAKTMAGAGARHRHRELALLVTPRREPRCSHDPPNAFSPPHFDRNRSCSLSRLAVCDRRP